MSKETNVVQSFSLTDCWVWESADYNNASESSVNLLERKRDGKYDDVMVSFKTSTGVQTVGAVIVVVKFAVLIRPTNLKLLLHFVWFKTQ